MTLEVISTGPMLSIQDQGRSGLRHFGVSAAGPMDAPSLALANALCGNSTTAAGLEFAGVGGRFRADHPIHFAVTGGDCEIKVGDRLRPTRECHRLEPGEDLQIGFLRGATWGYLAIAGGIDVPEVLNARATHLRFGLGGHEGRVLKAGDRLPLGPPPEEQTCLRALPSMSGSSHRDGPIRIVLGPQDGYFSDYVKARLTEEAFTITPKRDRMATVLEGPPLPAERGHDIVSDGTIAGAIQVPGSGQPMVLMAEAQTTGGYPKIATVISSDLPRLAQMVTGTQFRFAVVDRDAAEEIAIEEAARLDRMLRNLAVKADRVLSSDYLLSCDLIGGFSCPEQITGDD
ncbi:biotin-dependent carboxyltransferase family protein [Tropicimonas sp. IMCC6043]|uniref:5-oxoprolinase subunit C family protein n=1 Tax=Tropicimonas sp. IMCC6043 TaxID=2510645 RepID=UPI00101CF48E|nr:biotin-dependent carboxyltransferase family protein [Tropicimonas sp. IMCC6043]RYH06087.1 biotin-dependent carboxyltransferase [Tropicimonas sp. IMCC6043]